MLAATRNMSALAGCLARTRGIPPPGFLAPGFPQLYSVELEKKEMYCSVLLTGLAFPLAEKAAAAGGSQLLLHV